MDVLLLQDISGVGKKNDLIRVGDGYALNCLLPQQKALVATPSVRKTYADAIRTRAEQREQERELKADMAAALHGKEVHFTRKATKTGKLYAAITEKDIAEALQEQLSAEVADSAISIPEQIKAVGSFTASLALGDATENIAVTVAAEA